MLRIDLYSNLGDCISKCYHDISDIVAEDGLNPVLSNDVKKCQHTPFFMVYSSEAMLPTDLEYGSPRLKVYNEQSNKETRENTVDQLEEARDMSLLNSARYQQKLRRYHDKHVRKRDLNVGDLVLRRRQSNQGRHKLTPPWEGPYVVAEVLKPGTYKLADEKGAVFTNAWKIEQLHRFYP